MTGHLIHVGFAKAGSSYLQAWFRAHPQLLFRPGSFGGFASVLDLMQHAAGPAQLPRYYVTSSELLTAPQSMAGGATAGLARYPEPEAVADAQARVCHALASLYPDARILIVTRGFRAMLMSSYSEYVRTGGVQPPHRRFVPRDAAVFAYDRVIDLYRAAFPGRVTVLPFEMLAADPAAFRREIEGALGIDPHPFDDAPRNAALNPAELAWYRRLAAAAQRMPFRRRARRIAAGLAFGNRLAGAIRVLDRLFPVRGVTADDIPDAVLEALRGQARAIATEPVFRPYAAAYLESAAAGESVPAGR